MSASTLLVWTLVSTGVLASSHLLLYRRFVVDPALSPAWTRRLRVTLVVLAVATFLLFSLVRSVPREFLVVPAYVVYSWMALFSIVATLLLPTELVRLARRLGATLRRKKESDEPENQERRLWLRRAFAGSLAGIGGLSTGYAVAGALRGFKTVRVDVRLERLPRSFDGYRIVQVSDIHIGPTIGGDFIREMVARGNAEAPDLIAITGDLVDGSVENLGPHAAPLAEFRAKDGVYFVTGNHEYYSGAEDWIRELARLGIPTLRNERMELRRGDDVVDLVGVTDHRAGQFDDAPDLARALEGRDPSRESILLAHQPVEVFRAREHDIGLQLSGHTHGGQYWPFSWLIYLVQPVVKGLARFGRTQVYVSSGTGYWGPPARSGTEAELTVVTLRCA